MNIRSKKTTRDRLHTYHSAPSRIFPAEILEQRITPASFNWSSLISGGWELALNWTVTSGTDSDGIPDADDQVTINPAGEITVTVGTGTQTALSLSIPGNDHLAVAGGSLTISNPSTVNSVLVSGGTLNAVGQLTLTGPSTLSGSGTLSGIIRNEGTLSISSGDPNLNTGTLTNAGTIAHGNASLDFELGGSLVNAASGIYDLQHGLAGGYMRPFGGPGIDNAGTFRRSGAGDLNLGGVPFDNLQGGRIDVTAGGLHINSSGTWEGAAISVAAGATLNVSSGTKTWNGTFTGAGGGAVVFGDGAIAVPTAATLNFASGHFQWSGSASFTGGGTVINANSLTISGGDPNLNNVTLSNAGTIIHGNATLDFETGGLLINQATGLYNLSHTSAGGYMRDFGGPGIDNLGTFRRSATGDIQIGGVAFDNLSGGIIDVTAGSLHLNGPGTWQGATIKVATGATLNVGSSLKNWSGDFTATGGGAVVFGDGTISAASVARLDFAPGMFRWSGSATFTGGGTVTNANVITITGGDPNLNNITLSNAASILHGNASLDFEVGGLLVNESSGTYDLNFGTGGGYMRSFGGSGIDNLGVFRRSAVGDAQIGGVPFDNLPGGRIDVTAGGLHINSSGTWQGATISVSNGATLNLGSGTKAISGVMTGTGAGAVVFGDGAMSIGTAGVVLDFVPGLFRWNGSSTFNGGGAVVNTGAITLNGGDPNLNAVTFLNAGTFIHGNATLDFETGGKFVNLAGGSYDLTSPVGGGYMRAFGGPGFDNAGSFRRTATGDASIGGVTFNNLPGGSITVTSGGLHLNGGGNWQGASITVAAGANLNLSSNTKVMSGILSGSGAGTVTFSDGTMSTGPSGAILAFAPGLFRWNGSATFGGGIFTNLGEIALVGGDPNLNNATLVNAGTFLHGNANLDFEQNGKFVNQTDALYDITSPSGGGHMRMFGGSGFENSGTFRRVTGPGIHIGGVPFSNTGTVEVSGSGLDLNGTITQLNGGVLGGGTWKVGPGGTLTLPANVTTNKATVLLGGAAPQLDAIATNDGSLTLTDGRDFTRNGPFTNNGTLTAGPGSAFTASTFAQASTGTTVFQIAGTGAANHGQLSVASAATLAGKARAEVVGGFEPGAGDSFTLMNFGSRTGDFTSFDGLRLGRGVAFERVFDPTGLRLNSLVNAADLDVVSITNLPANGIAAQNFAFSYTVQNTSTFATVTPSWVDSIYLSVDDEIDPSDKLVTRVARNGAVAGGASYTENVSVALPGALPGNFRLLVLADSRGLVPDPDRADNFLASTGSVAVDIPTLTDGVAINGTIANGQDLYFRISLPKDKTPSVQVSSTKAGVSELYTRLSDVPTRAVFDASDFGAGDLTQQVFQPAGAAGTYYVLLHGREAAGTGQAFTLLADALDLGVTGLSTTAGANIGSVTMRIDGSLFSRNTAFALVPSGGGAPIPATAAIFQNPTASFATFNLAGVAPGSYNVVASDGAATDTLLNAFTVTSGTVRTPFGGVAASATTEGQLKFDVSSPSFIRPPFRGVVATITYENVGGTDIPAPLFEVISSNARMRLADQTGFSTGVLEFLGVNPNGFAGTLPPGAHGSIDVIFEPINGTAGQEVKFEVFPVRAPGDFSTDWDKVKDALQPDAIPDAAWDVVFQNFKNGAGSDFGSYHRMLVENANYLSQFGRVSPDSLRLVQFELVQADDFGAISERYQISSLGRGQAEPFGTRITTDAFGNATITDGSETRGFVKQADGSFIGTGSELGKLTLSGTTFTLDEGDGNKVVFKADGRIDFIQGTNDRRVTASYDGNGRIRTLTDSSTGDVTTYNYTGARLTSVTDAVGRTTTYGFTGDDLTSLTTPQGTSTFTYVTGQGAAREHALATATTPDGVTTFYTYDTSGRLATKTVGTGPQAVALTYTYDGAGRMTETDAAGKATQLFRLPTGGIGRTVDATGLAGTAGFDINGRVTGTSDSAGPGLQTTYDAQGELNKIIDGLRGETTLDIGGTLRRLQSVTDPGGDTTHFVYDAKGNLKSVALPGTADGAADVRYDYDSKGRVEASYDAAGRRTGFTYNAKDLIERTDLPDGTSINYTYDPHRNLETATDSEGTTTYTYDSADRVTSIAYPNGRKVTIDYDPQGRRSVVKDGTGFEVRYTYDTLGRLDTVRDQAGALLVDYDYNTLGQLAKETRGNGATTTYTYDDAGRTDTITHRDAANAVTDSFNYDYDARGRIQSVVTPGGTTTYSYDAADQLTVANLPGGRVITFAYDSEGNRRVTSDTASGTENYTTNVRDQYDSAGGATFTYDPDGRLATRTENGATTTYTYDSRGRLVSISSPGELITYDYDALGYRIGVTKNGVRTDFAYDPAGLGTLFGEYSGNTANAHYVSGIGIAARVANGGTAAFYHFDGTGSTALLSGTAGAALATYDYLPFGGIASQTGSLTNPFTFNGRDGVQDDPDDLFFTRARYFDADIGRFISRDPAGLQGGDTNLYRYAGNDPINLGDPSGFYPIGYSTTIGPVPGGLSLPFNGLPAGAAGSSVPLGAYPGGLVSGPPAQITTVNLARTSASNPAFTGRLVLQTGNGLFRAAPLGVTLVAGTVAAAGGVAVGTYINNNVLTEGDRRGLQQTLAEQFNLGPSDGSALYDGTTIGNEAYARYRQSVRQDPLFRGVYQSLIDNGSGPQEAFERAAELLRNYRREHPEEQPKEETTSRTVRPGDPNNIVGPRGFGADPVPTVPTPGQVRFDGFVAGDGDYGYTILFENMPTATAPAQVVKVTQTLDADLDLSTFEWRTFGWGETKVTVPENNGTPTIFHSQVDGTADAGVLVNVDAELNPLNRVITVTFTSIDPLTGDVPLDPFAGFLPPNITNPQGDGFITYSISPKAGFASGTKFDALASIVFDTEAPLNTPSVHNTVDSIAPTSIVTPFTSGTTSRPSFRVGWSAADDANGSGLRGTTILFTDTFNGVEGPLTPFVAESTAAAAAFSGAVGHTYRFYSTASDNVGNTEAPSTSAPDATVTVVAPTFVEIGKKKSFTDSDGDRYTVKYNGPGVARVALSDPDGDGNGAIDFLVIEGSSLKSKIGITVKKSANGDGAVTIGDATIDGSLAAFTAQQSDIVANGLTATGTVKKIAVRDLLQPDVILANPLVQLAGGATDSTSITARTLSDGFRISTPGVIKKLGTSSVGEGTITAAALKKLDIATGDFKADLLLTGVLGALSVKKGSLVDATITATQISSLKVGDSLTNTLILAGASLGVDGALGGTGAGADLFASGSIGAVQIGGDVTASVIGAGLSTTDGVLKNSDDSIIGGLTSAIAKVIVKGQADSQSYFAAGQFKKAPLIAGEKVDPAGDPRFLLG